MNLREVGREHGALSRNKCVWCLKMFLLDEQRAAVGTVGRIDWDHGEGLQSSFCLPLQRACRSPPMCLSMSSRREGLVVGPAAAQRGSDGHSILNSTRLRASGFT